MSLILEALRKLEREKQTPERGLVVTGASAWARAEERRGLRLGLIAVVGLSLGAGVWLWRGRAVQAPVSTAAAESGGPAPAGVPAQGPADLRLTTRPQVRTPAASGAANEPRPATAAAGSGALTRSGGTTSAAPAADAAHAPLPPEPAGVAITESATDGETRPTAGASAQPRTATGSDPAREQAPTPAAAAGERVAAAPGEVTLQAVTERDGRPLAIVNGRLVREGDSFDGIRILHIRPSEIEVEIEGKRRTVGF